MHDDTDPSRSLSLHLGNKPRHRDSGPLPDPIAFVTAGLGDDPSIA